MSPDVPRPSQITYPWRATLRTVIQVVVALAAVTPLVIAAIEADSPGLLGPVGVVAVGVAAAITRVMAIPLINEWLTKLGIGATPRYTEVNKPQLASPTD